MRGKLRRLFYVLSDDHIGSGPRPAPHSLEDPVEKVSETDHDHDHDYAGSGANEAMDQEMQSTSNQTVKRKATNTGEAVRGKSRR
jgi:hypothetical protein